MVRQRLVSRPPWGLRTAAALTLCGALVACQPARAAPTPTAVPPSATSTIAFPTLVPTETPTAGPSGTPTPDLSLEKGALLFTDRFDDPALWRLHQSETGGSSIGGGRLSISVRVPRTSELTTRIDSALADALVEVDVLTELCSPGDEFGLALRVTGLTQYYRFVIGCDGTARAGRLLDEGSRALTWPIPSPAILPSAPSRNHLAILARGDRFHFLVNDVEVLAVRDVALIAGGIGLLARSGSGGQVSVAFDDLTVHALSDAHTATPTSAPTPPP